MSGGRIVGCRKGFAVSGVGKMAAIAAALLFLTAGHGKANTQEPSPSPTPKSSVHRHRHKTNRKQTENSDEDSGARKSRRHSSGTTNARKSPEDQDSEKKPKPKAAPTPTPSPTPKQSPGPTPSPAAQKRAAGPNATLTSDELTEFDKLPGGVKKLLESALALTRQNLTYTYGSADPTSGGMDCSGFIYYVLRQNGFDDVPRDASGQYVWVRKAKTFQAVLSKQKETFELDDLRPGDLLFWTGTYDVAKDPPVTHTMIYLGTEKATHKRVMVGSSDGRSYNGKARWGVSVFDFKGNSNGNGTQDPQKQRHASFVGYARIPGLGRD